MGEEKKGRFIETKDSKKWTEKKSERACVYCLVELFAAARDWEVGT